jgi:hypothetical protein
VAATCGSVRTCDCILTMDPKGVNFVDLFGTTPLDNARSKKHPAAEALVAAAGGLPGSDVRVALEHERTLAWARNQRAATALQRRRLVQETLPETRLLHEAQAVHGALQRAVEVWIRTPPYALASPQKPTVLCQRNVGFTIPNLRALTSFAYLAVHLLRRPW